jgi:hypothetical protein
MHVGLCRHCEREALVGPLHLEKGGPEVCLHCGMKWHAKWTQVRKAGRVVVKAMKAYFAAGGKNDRLTLTRLELAAQGLPLHKWDEDTLGADVGDITLELLEDTIALTHPDVHPPERREKANRVTQELLALRPFVFPAPAPEPKAKPSLDPFRPRDGSSKSPHDDLSNPLLQITYPCELCVDVGPRDYCKACRAERDQRSERKLEVERARQRAWYRTRRDRYWARQRSLKKLPRCEACGAEFERRRKDSRYCSGACRQRAHRRRALPHCKRTAPLGPVEPSRAAQEAR